MKRYVRWFPIWGALYSVTVIGAQIIDRRLELEGVLRIALALSPVLPALLMLREFLIVFRSLDEVQQRIQAEAILTAAGVVGFGSFAWGFLEGAFELPAISLIWVLPVMIAVWGAALPFVSRRYS